MPPSMHATDTLDYLVITAGKLSLDLEEGEVEVAAGDIVVNRGNIHAWLLLRRRPVTASRPIRRQETHFGSGNVQPRVR